LGASRNSRSDNVSKEMRFWKLSALTSKSQLHKDSNSEFQEQYVQYKVSVIVVRNAVIHPRAVAGTISIGPM
jgi:hypothetical protein